MIQLKNYTVEHVQMNCPFDLAWDYLQNPVNQKDWGVHFFQDIKKVGGGYLAVVPFGEIPFSITATKETGVLDLNLGGGTPIPTRLIASGEESCLYTFVLFQPEGMPDRVWEQQGVPNMKEELQLLKKILEEKANTKKAINLA